MTRYGWGQKPRDVTWWILLLEHLLLPAVVLTDGNYQEVCAWENFEAKCPDDHVIVMKRAVYGRMRLGRCVEQDMGYLGCQMDVKAIVDSKCSGRKHCSFKIPDEDLEKKKPCRELVNYFEADYECKKVEALEARCHKCDYVRVQNEVGFLASAVTSESGCGSMACPWLISGGQRQYIRVSLIDFSLPDPDSTQYTDVCKVYAVIKEKDAMKSATICGGQGRNREREVYVSQGPELEIRIMGKAQSEAEAYFMIKYEVFGCQTLNVDGALVSYDGPNAMVTCDAIDKEWSLRCNGSHWQGLMNNCTLTEQEAPGQYSADPVFNSTSLIIMAAVALIICSLVVIIGVVCFKICTHSSTRPRRTPPSYEDPPDLCHPPPLTHDTYCVTHLPPPPSMTSQQHTCGDATTMTLDRCLSSKVTCKTYSFENGQKNEYEHICDSSVPRLDFNIT